MDLDWTTIALQLVNFIALMWLLKRLLYRPVLNVIAQRQAAIDQAQDTARDTQARAEALQASLKQQADELQQHRADELARMAAEVAQERQRRLAELDNELQKERARQNELVAAQLRNATAQAQDAADRLAYDAVGQLLGRLAGPALDDALLDLLLQDLPQLPADQHAALKQAAQAPNAQLEVDSVHPLSATQLSRLQAALATITGIALEPRWRTDPALIAGVRVGLGPWLLAANVADELTVFRTGLQRAH